MSSPTPSERASTDAAARAQELAEQALLPYKWTQTIQDLDITVPIPGALRSKDLDVRIEKEYLKVGIRGEGEAVIDGPLPHAIDPSESTWTLTSSSSLPTPTPTIPSSPSVPIPPPKDLSLHLSKRNKLQWWPAVTTNAPYQLDTARIVPENSKLGDLDGETRGMVEKMMYDQRQREMGKPTSEEQTRGEVLERFKRGHPEMDFGGVKMG